MTLILNGTDNSATVPAVQGGTAGTSTGLYYPTTSAVGISTAGTNAVYIDASQNVGIGTNSGTRKLNVYGGATSTRTMTVTSNASEGLEVGVNASNIATVNSAAGGAIIFTQADTERMRISSAGDLLVGATTANYSGSGFTLSKDSGTTKWQCGPNAGNPTQFIISAATSLGVYLTSTSATSWSSASDERLKDIIEPIADGIEKVCTLRSVIGTYKNDPEKNRRPFLIAQDLQKVFPEAVDASDPDRLGVQYTEVIPLLVAAIKEQQALITSLTARIEALEAR